MNFLRYYKHANTNKTKILSLLRYNTFYTKSNGENSNYRYNEPFQPIIGKSPKILSAKEAVKAVKSNDKIFIHGAAATPNHIIDALAEYGLAEKLSGVKLYHIHSHGDLPVTEKFKGIFHDYSLFMGKNVREAVHEGRADFIPTFLSDIPGLFTDNVIDLDVALIQVSPPDKHGFCSLGTSVDCTRAAVKNANFIIAQVNKYMPRTLGDGQIHISHVDCVVEFDKKLYGWDTEPAQINPVQQKIGERVASLIQNTSTIQLGIGAIPNAVCNSLKNHQNLGLHSEMFMDGVVDLIKAGVITNSHKNVHRGKNVGSFVVGSKKLYTFLDDNPSVAMLSCGYTNQPAVIRRIDNMVAINSALEIDLTGQVVAESLGEKMLSGVGGQVDFMRGAALSKGGMPIMALPSTSNKGESRITSRIAPGAAVTTSRSHIRHVVTEYGHVDLRGKSMRERAKLLIQIAHPSHRERLTKEAAERFKVFD